MDWELLAHWEWLLIHVIILALAVAELISLRRTMRRTREGRRDDDPRA